MKNHDEILKGIKGQCDGLLKHSAQAIYVYLDESHKICNKKFATMLGYASPDAWAKQRGSFIQSYVDGKSQSTLVGAYQTAMNKLAGSALKVTWKTKGGKNVNTTVLLVPMIHEGHAYALHFIEKI